MKTIVYVAPFPMRTTMQFAEALASLRGNKTKPIRLIGIFQQAPTNPEIFDHLLIVSNVLNLKEMAEKIQQIIGHFGEIYRLLGILENLQEVLAGLRDKFNIRGMRSKTILALRDKTLMKQMLQQAGIPCAQFQQVTSWRQAVEFVRMIGFPVVVKPPMGAGCKSTFRCASLGELQKAFEQIQEYPILIEEFLTGTEHSLESFVRNGTVELASCSHYYPTPLEVINNPWIQWVVHFPIDITDKKFQDAMGIGKKVVDVLGVETAMTHMEWFCRSDGRIAVGEIGARPPGARFVDCTGLVHNKNAHLAWAKLVVHDEWEPSWKRRNSVAVAFLRGQGKGKIHSITGLEQAQQEIGNLVTQVNLPKIGAQPSSSYEGDGWVILQGDNDQRVLQAANRLVHLVRVHCQ